MAKLSKDNLIQCWWEPEFAILRDMTDWYDQNVAGAGLSKEKGTDNFWGNAKYPSKHKTVENHFMRTYIDKLKSHDVFLVCCIVDYLIQERESLPPNHIKKQNDSFIIKSNIDKQYEKNTPLNKMDKWFAVANLIDCQTKWRA